MCTTDKWMSEFFLTQRDGGPPNPRDSAKPQCDWFHLLLILYIIHHHNKNMGSITYFSFKLGWEQHFSQNHRTVKKSRRDPLWTFNEARMSKNLVIIITSHVTLILYLAEMPPCDQCMVCNYSVFLAQIWSVWYPPQASGAFLNLYKIKDAAAWTMILSTVLMTAVSKIGESTRICIWINLLLN